MAKSEANETTNMRDRILAVATELFSAKGFEGVSIRNIANEVGVKLPTLYYYFKDKRDLYEEVESTAYGEARDRLAKVLHLSGTPEERLRKFLEELISILDKDIRFYRLVQRNLLESDPENRKFLVKNGLQALFDGLKNVIESLDTKTNADIATMGILASVIGFIGLKGGAQFLDNYNYAKKPAKANQALVEAILYTLEYLPKKDQGEPAVS